MVTLPKEQPILQLLSKRLKLTSQNTKLLSDLSQSFEIQEWQLGECLLSLPKSLSNYVQNKQNCEYFYIICQGRVRLLSFEGEKQREISVQLLTEGETIGGDSLFCDFPLSYRAVAASKVQVARINLQQLKPWLEMLPEIKENWLEAAQTRQRLLFFKTLPFLSTLSSQRLQQLLAYIEEKKIPAGEYLAQAISDETGLFWLRRGKIKDRTLEKSCSSGYPEPIPADGVAQTDLWLYWLPKQNWEKAFAIAPDLVNALPDQPSSNGKTNDKATIIKDIKAFPPLSSSISPPKKLPPVPEQPSVEIEFPKPIKRRRWWATGYPFIEQQSSSDCGAACLAMISQYWGKNLSLNYLRNLAGVGRSGASLKNLAKAAERLGYMASPVRATLKPLVEQNKPWIAHWQGDHYVVVYRLKGDRLLIADPAQGKRTISRQEFLTDDKSMLQMPNRKAPMAKT